MREGKPTRERSTLAPTRERGRRRVEAILSAAAEVMSELGVGAATMAEIAARSNTHVGSLYRFFPTKEALADALLDRYVVRVQKITDRLIVKAKAMSAPDLAQAFLDLMLDLRKERAFAMQLAADARVEGDRRRRIVSDLMFHACVKAVSVVLPNLSATRAETVGQTLLYLGKVVVMTAEDEDQGRPAVVTEIRWLASHYLIDQGVNRCDSPSTTLAPTTVRVPLQPT